MAAAARREARRKRILENSGDRLQKIIGSQNSTPKIDRQSYNRPVVELQSKDFSENSEKISKESSSTDQPEVDGHFSSPATRLDEGTRHENEEHINKSTKRDACETTEVKENLKGGWIRSCLNVLLGVFLVVVSKREVNGILQYFFGPWIALHIFMFSIPLLRQDISSSWLSVFKVALQLSGIPANYTSVLNTLYISFVLLLLDFPLFIFTTVMTKQISVLLTGGELI